MSASDITAAEYRALGRLMRHARAEGYTYRISSAFGRTDWSWAKDHKYAVVAEPLAVGWKVTFDDGRADLWPASVQQLTDVLVALGLLPIEFRSEPMLCGEPFGDSSSITCTYVAGHAPITKDVRGCGERDLQHGNTEYSVWWNGNTATVHGDALEAGAR